MRNLALTGSGIADLEWTEAFTLRRFAFALGLLIFACFPSVLLGSETFFFRDFGFFSYPIAAYCRECFWRGEIPLWNPYNNCGIPFVAQWNTMVFYPGSLIYLLLPLPWSLNFFCLAHFYLAGLGMFVLARSWTRNGLAAGLGAVAFTFGGVLLSCLKWPNNIAALGLMPWVVWSVERALNGGTAKVLCAIGIGSLQMLAGAPEVIILTWVIAGALALVRPPLPKDLEAAPTEQSSSLVWRILRLGGIVAGIAGVCAIQLLPFLDLLAHSQRDATFGRSQWPMPPWGWANFFLPLFRTFISYHGVHAQPNQYWISTYYVPLLALSLAGAALVLIKDNRARMLGGLTLLCLLLALGDAAGIYKMMRTALPFMGVMRFPIKFVVVAGFTLPLLGAVGLDHLLRGKFEARAFFVSIGAVALLVVGVLAFSRSHPFALEDAKAVLMNGLLRLVFIGVAAALLHALTRPLSDVRRMALGSALLLVVAVDGLTHTTWENPVAPTFVYDPGVAELTPKPELGRSRAMISPEALERLDHLSYSKPVDDILASRLSLFSNCNLLDDIPKVDGFYALLPSQNALITLLLYARTNALYPGLMDFLSVSHLTRGGKTLEWITRTNELPWLTGGAQPVIADIRDTILGLTATNFDCAKSVFVRAKDKALAPLKAAGMEITNATYSAHKVTAEVRTQGPALLVLNQTWYHWWKATVDGAEVPILPANLAFQAIALPAGQHTIAFTYRDKSFQIGACVSTAAVLVIGGLFVRARRKGIP